MTTKALVWLVICGTAEAVGCGNSAPQSPAGAAGASAQAGSAGGVNAAGNGGTGGAPAQGLGGTGGALVDSGGAGSAALGGASVGGASAGAGGGSAGAAGSAGATANAGAGGAAGASGCIGLFCEDFESGQIDAAKWDTQKNNGTLELVQDQVAHGKYAAHFHGLDLATAKTSDYAFLIAKSLPTELKTHHFGRLSFYITPAPKSGHTGMVWAGTTGFPKPTYEEVANIGGGWQLGYVKLMGSPGDEKVAYPPGKVPAMKWTCMEWEFNDQPNMMSLWINGTLLGVFDDNHIDYPPGHVPGSPISNGMSSGLVGGFVNFGLGFYDWHPQNAFDLYYDDLVLDVKRVGCTGAGAP